MEHALADMARRLDALDEASLMSLWDKYAETVAHFEPSKRWEEAAMILGLIQTKHWKNQLFNARLAASLNPGSSGKDVRLPSFAAGDRESPEERRQPIGGNAKKESGKPGPSARILAFRKRGN